MIESPRKKFHKDKNAVDRHLRIVTRPEFQATVDAVLLEYSRNLPKTASPAQSWNIACKLEGAREALELLLEFADVAAPLKQPLSPTMESV